MSQPTKQELIDHIESLVTKVEELIRERDEARRQVCRALYTDEAMRHNHAKICGWDCFKENTNV